MISHTFQGLTSYNRILNAIQTGIIEENKLFCGYELAAQYVVYFAVNENLTLHDDLIDFYLCRLHNDVDFDWTLAKYHIYKIILHHLSDDEIIEAFKYSCIGVGGCVDQTKFVKWLRSNGFNVIAVTTNQVNALDASHGVLKKLMNAIRSKYDNYRMLQKKS